MSDDEIPREPAPATPDPSTPESFTPESSTSEPRPASVSAAPVLSGAETVQWIVLGVVAFFGLPLLGAATYGIGFVVGVGWLGWAGARAWRRGEPSRARVRRFLIGLLLGLVIFGGCTVLVLGNLGTMH